MSPVHQVWSKTTCKAQWKGREDKADRGRGRTTILGIGQAWSSLSPRGQWRTGENGEKVCKIICGTPKTLAVEGQMMMSVHMVRYDLSVYPVWCQNTLQCAWGQVNFGCVISLIPLRYHTVPVVKWRLNAGQVTNIQVCVWSGKIWVCVQVWIWLAKPRVLLKMLCAHTETFDYLQCFNAIVTEYEL